MMRALAPLQVGIGAPGGAAVVGGPIEPEETITVPLPLDPAIVGSG